MGEANFEQSFANATKQQLINRVNQLQAYISNLTETMKDMDLSNAFKRLDYLFKVLDNKDSFESDFLSNVTSEIVEMLTITHDVSDNENVKAE